MSSLLLLPETMQCANWHIYQVLTKRADRLVNMLESNLAEFASVEAYLVGSEC